MNLRSQARRALVVGATGAIGRALVERLLASPLYGEVHTLVRRASTDGAAHAVERGLVEHCIDFENLGELDATELGLEGKGIYVFCALGTTLKRAGSKEAFRRVDLTYVLGVGRLAHRLDAACCMVVTSMGASPNGWSFYLQVKGEAEKGLAELGLPSLVLVRPSLLLTDRNGKRPGEEMAGRVLGWIRPLLSGPLLSLRPIEPEQVAAAMVHGSQMELPGSNVVEADELHRWARAMGA